MRHVLAQLEDVFYWFIWGLFTSSLLIFGYVRFVFRWLPKRRLALILSWVASIATVYLLGWSSLARQLGVFRVYALMSFVPLTYFWVKGSGATRLSASSKKVIAASLVICGVVLCLIYKTIIISPATKTITLHETNDAGHRIWKGPENESRNLTTTPTLIAAGAGQVNDASGQATAGIRQSGATLAQQINTFKSEPTGQFLSKADANPQVAPLAQQAFAQFPQQVINLFGATPPAPNTNSFLSFLMALANSGDRASITTAQQLFQQFSVIMGGG